MPVTRAAAVIDPAEPVSTRISPALKSPATIKPVITGESAVNFRQNTGDQVAVYSLIPLCRADVIYIFMSGLVKIKLNH